MTTRKVNKPVVQKENCFVEEIKEVELRSRRWKFIYNRTKIRLKFIVTLKIEMVYT